MKPTKCSVQKKRQYNNKRLAERAMLNHYVCGRSIQTIPKGSYQCPYCYYWHLTSEYDNRSKQSRHEFNCENRKRKKRSKPKLPKRHLSTTEQKDIFKNFKPTVYKRKWTTRVLMFLKRLSTGLS